MPTLYLPLFVYGTLMRAAANHAVLERLGAVFRSEATTRDPRTLVDLGPYPALLRVDARVAEPPTSCVAGELWNLPMHAFDELDAFEGCPDLFTRVTIDLASTDARDGSTISAQVYVLTNEAPHARVITSRKDGHPTRYNEPGEVLPDGAKAAQVETKIRPK